VNDDDILRRALHRPPEPISSYRVLQDLRPTMRRARHRRRVTVGATAALLLLGGGAGVLALTSGPTSPTVRTSSDENGAVASTLPPVTEPLEDRQVSDDPNPSSTAAVPVPLEAPAPLTPVEDEPEAPEPPEAAAPPAPAPKPAPAPAAPPPAKPEMPTTTPAPAPAAAPPAPVVPTTQVLTSDCGDVVVEIDGRTVHIASITPLAGYTPRVTTDGPESVEMKFLGTGDSCEVHAELRSSVLDVEIQRSDRGD
jgi:hypothetical protein